MKNLTKRLSTLVAATLTALSSHAALVATPTGPFAHLDDGYTATLFSSTATGGTGVGLAWDAAGHLLRSDFSGGIYVSSLLADTTINGTNTLHSAVRHQVTGDGLPGFGITMGLDGYLYGQGGGGQLRRINPTTFVSTAVAGTTGGYYGIKTLSNGKIVYNANNNTVHLYDPTTGTDTAIYNSGTFNDDIAVTPDGYIVVASLGSCRTDIITQTGVLVRQQASSHCADGMAYGQGSIFKNNTDGTLTRLDFAGANYTGAITETIIADGFSYGDLAAVGPDNAFYITTSNAKYANGVGSGAYSVVRIEKVGGGGFGAEVPEPGSLALASLALAGLTLSLRRKATKA